MKNTQKKRQPFFRQLIVPLILVSIIQVLIFRFAVASSGILGSIDENAENILYQHASKSNLHLETEMLKKWCRIDDLVDKAVSCVEVNVADTANFHADSDEGTAILNDVSDEIIGIIRSNVVNGAFISLCDTDKQIDSRETKGYQSIYITDSDPYHNSVTNSDLMMGCGPASIASKYNIPLDIGWTDKIYSTASNRNRWRLLFEPVTAAYNNPKLNYENLGYWGTPFNDNNPYDTVQVITYSVPILYDGEVFGVVGISISLEHIMSYLPSDEINNSNSGGYMLVSYEHIDNDKEITATVSATSGKGMNRVATIGSEISMSKVKQSPLLYTINDTISADKIYVAMSNMSVYKANTPFENNMWAVLAVSDERSLYSVTQNMSFRIGIAMLISLVISSLLAYVVSKHTVKPVTELANVIKNYTGQNEIPITDVDIKEIYELSLTINSLSIDLARTRNDLLAEKERYIIALQSANDDMIEYDPIMDIFIMYNFGEKDADGHFKTERHTHFIGQVQSGNICHIDDIPVFKSFLSGEMIDRFTLRMKNDVGIDGYKWLDVSGKPIFSTDNKLQKVIASFHDITDNIAQEMIRLDEERRDKITKFYKHDYGELLIRNKLTENAFPNHCFARLLISNSQKIRSRIGNFYFDAILEEFSIIVNRTLTPNDVVFRSKINEFIIFKADLPQDEIFNYFNKLRKSIEKIHSQDENSIPLRCCIGICTADDSHADQVRNKYCVGLAVCAAELRTRNHDHGMVVTFKDVAEDTVALQAYNDFETADTDIIFDNPNDTENENLISFALNIFEKTNGFDNAMNILLAKAGRAMKMSRIIIYDINTDFYNTTISHQWYQHNVEPLPDKVINIGKAELSRLKKMFEETEYIKADSYYVDPVNTVINEMIDVFPDGASLIFPLFENNDYIGNIVFESPTLSIRVNDIALMKEITKIIAAYVSKSRTSLESRAKSEFLSRMSHEIRTPMNAILGMTNIALSSGDTPFHVTDYLNKIDRSAQYLMSLINDILDMSRIESGKMTVEKTYINLDSVISQLDTMIRVQTDEKNIGLIMKKSVEHVHLIGDPLKLNQVLINILGNAVKFTSSGSITFSVNEVGFENDSEVNIGFSIKDTGIGIAEENIGRIFNSFEQENTNTARKFGGTGLGLTISNNLVNMMGGELIVESALGVGTEFKFVLPFEIADESQIINEDDNTQLVDFTNKRILLVEDDELNVEIAVSLLGMDGIITECAENGKIAVEIFEAAAADYYDAILMDIRMPVMDGLEATKLIRNLNREDAVRIPIIAMSANAFDADMKKSVECGMNGHLSKPVDMAKVRALLSKIWRK